MLIYLRVCFCTVSHRSCPRNSVIPMDPIQQSSLARISTLEKELEKLQAKAQRELRQQQKDRNELQAILLQLSLSRRPPSGLLLSALHMSR